MRLSTSFSSTSSGSTPLIFLSLLLLNSSLSAAHSWLDCTNMQPWGCAGFPLGYPSRADRDINTKYTYLVKDRLPDAALCQPGRQNIPGNNPFPAAIVTPGQNLHLTWQPDGHLDDAHPSTIEVHWSGVPGKQLYTRAELSPETLLGTMTFATSANCDQAWEPNTWCHGHLTVPWGIQPGTYQMIWWWKYDRNPSGEEYSTCFEILVNGNAIQPREIPVQALSQTHVEDSVSSSDKSVAARREQPLQLDYMTSDSESFPLTGTGYSMTDDTTDSKAETLKDLASKPDEPLSVIPNYAINEDSSEDRLLNNDYVGDDTGALAGDAINDEEGVDVSPLPIATPSQLINNTLSGQVRTINGTTNNSVNINNSTMNSVMMQNGTQSANHINSTINGNSTSGVPNFRPENSGVEHGVSSSSPASPSHNQTLVGQLPSFDNGASDIGAHSLLTLSGSVTFSSVFALLTWMVV